METNNTIEGWNEFYKHKEAFGTPYKELESFLNDVSPKGKLLDLGAGQGRNSILSHLLGYEVLAVDYSSVGIQTIIEHGIKGVVDDIYKFDFKELYQVIILDAVIHCQTEDLKKEELLFKNIEENLEGNGFLLLLTHQWDMRENYLINLFQTVYPTLQLQFNKYIEHIFTPPHSEEESIMELSFMCFQKK